MALTDAALIPADASDDEFQACVDAMTADLGGVGGRGARVAGSDVHPGGEDLKHWWTQGPGLALWADNPHPWTTLFNLLLDKMDGNVGLAKKTAGAWYFKVFGHGPTADKDHDRRWYGRSDEFAQAQRADVTSTAGETVSVHAARALLAAFDDRYEGLDNNSRALRYQRDWDPKDHPKWPKGHPQGGKFRPTASVILEALAKRPKGDPFEDLSDAQLKKVADGRGVEIPAGADREETIKHLLDDLESKEGARRRPEGVDANSWDTLRALASGEQATVEADELPGLMDAIAIVKPPTFNFAKLQVAGEGNERLFRRHLSDERRKTMPQLPTETGPDLDRFEDFLRSSGVSFAYGKTDPRRLSATQSELSGPKVAKLFGFMRDAGWKKGGVLITSRDGAVIDGHHRWAGAAAASVARGGTLEVDTLVLDLDWEDALRAVKPFATFEDLAADRERPSA